MRLHLILLLCLLGGCSVADSTSFEFDPRRPIAAAHRAEHSKNSENSIDAIKAAQEEKIQFIEIDIRKSLEGNLFLFHNKKLDPETVKGPKELIGREFKTLSDAEIGRVVLPKGERIPSFEAAVEALVLNASFILDVKGEGETRKKVIEIIRDRGANKQYWMLCYDPGCISEIKNSGIHGLEVLARLNNELSLSQALETDSKIFQIDCEQSCSHQVTEIKSRKRSALVLATSLKPELDCEPNWKRVLKDGVDIILTDKPLELKSIQSNFQLQNQEEPVPLVD